MPNEDIKIEFPSTRSDNFTFYVGCTVTLNKHEIWPKGNAPDNPNSSDVLWQINEHCKGLSITKLIEECSLPVKVVIRPK